jgi:Obg family GTPase CgtA
VQNAKKGGQGGSKRRVGSRGLDKIVQVPVGTVVHLVTGSIPCLEQKPSVSPDQSSWEPWRLSSPSDVGPSATVADETQISSAAWLESLCLDSGRRRIIKSAYGTDAVEEQGLREQEEGSSDGSIILETACESEGCVEDADLLEDPDLDSIGSKEDLECPGDVGAEKINFSAETSSSEDEEETVDCLKPQVQYSVAEFITPGQTLAMAKGGEGGRGNAAMARGTGSQKALPSHDHEPGLPGSEAILILELKMIADVGLVGAPNAGKSTLLGALSRAKPAVGHYAFTTLRPNIGKLEYEDFFYMTVADIPGLIRGAHENRGLGHAFLRHIERTKALAYVVDLSAGIGDRKGPLPWDQLEELMSELEMYEMGLSMRPALVVANKIDEPGADDAFEELKRRLPVSMPVFPVCAVLEEGISELRKALRELVDTGKSRPLILSHRSDIG